MWEEVIEIYPALLDCITCNSSDVRFALKDALKEFTDLLAVPKKPNIQNGTSKIINSQPELKVNVQLSE